MSHDSFPEPSEAGASGVRWILWLGIAAVSVTALLIVLSNPDEGPVGTENAAVGRSLGELKLEPLLGEVDSIRLEDLSGQVVVVNFWGPWCGPCRMEMPHLIELERKFREVDHFRFVSVSSGLGWVYRPEIDEIPILGWILGALICVLAILGFFWQQRGGKVPPSIADRLNALISLDWLYFLLKIIFDYLSRLIFFISNVLEGEGGLLWVLLWIVLFLAILLIGLGA